MSSFEAIREREAHEDGKPWTCDFQGGMFWCQSRSFMEVHWTHEGGWGWVCVECRHFHISKKQHLANLLNVTESEGDYLD